MIEFVEKLITRRGNLKDVLTSKSVTESIDELRVLAGQIKELDIIITMANNIRAKEISNGK